MSEYGNGNIQALIFLGCCSACNESYANQMLFRMKACDYMIRQTYVGQARKSTTRQRYVSDKLLAAIVIPSGDSSVPVNLMHRRDLTKNSPDQQFIPVIAPHQRMQ